jgi:hypothetical protein
MQNFKIKTLGSGKQFIKLRQTRLIQIKLVQVANKKSK